MKASKLALWLSFALCASFAGCGRPDKKHAKNPESLQLADDVTRKSDKGHYYMSVHWTTTPVAEQELTAVLSFFLNEDRSKPATSVQITKFLPWMPSMNHGGSKEHTLRQLAPNQIEVSEIYFTMGGLWELRTKAVVDGVEDQLYWSLELP